MGGVIYKHISREMEGVQVGTWEGVLNVTKASILQNTSTPFSMASRPTDSVAQMLVSVSCRKQKLWPRMVK